MQSPNVLRRIWERMLAIYPHRWGSALGAAPQHPDGKFTVAGETWAKGLAGLTTEHIATGLRNCVTRSNGDGWPPALDQFRAWCLDIPDLIDVIEELRPGNNAEKSPFVRLVWMKLIDPWECQNATATRRAQLIERAYRKARQHVLELKPLPQKPIAAIEVTPHEHKPADPSTARSWIDRTAQKFEEDRDTQEESHEG